jgi:hypothetical protein
MNSESGDIQIAIRDWCQLGVTGFALAGVEDAAGEPQVQNILSL